MAQRRKSSIIFFLSLQAMAVAIICFGSLINFHQYKIWGKPLILNFVGYKRDVEKYSKTISFSKLANSNQNFQKDHQSNDFDFPFATIQVQDRPVLIISFDLTQKVPASNRIFSCGLRGPPIS